MTTEADRAAAARGLVPVLVGVTLVISIVSSLGAPLLPEVAQSLDVSLDSRAVVADGGAARGDHRGARARPAG